MRHLLAVKKYVAKCSMYRSLRCAAYKALNTWMQNLGCSCGTEMFAGDVIQHCLADCTPSADSLKVMCMHGTLIVMAYFEQFIMLRETVSHVTDHSSYIFGKYI